MISSTLGAPLGGTTVGGHQGFESLAFSLITPPNFGGGGGNCLPSMVVVALGEPGTPVTCCADAPVAITPDSATVSDWMTNCVDMSVLPYRGVVTNGTQRRSPVR